MRERFKVRGDQAPLNNLPVHALVNIVRIPSQAPLSPWWLIVRRFFYALVLLLVASVICWLDKDGYSEHLTFIDALYYSTVSLTTTGYGDITPVTENARIVNILVITPMRIVFLVLLVGTTLSVLTEASRRALQIQRWRRQLRNHTVVVGYRGLVTVNGSATKADVLRLAGVSRARSVVVAPNMDDTAVLVTLSVREIAPSATIVASVRESENVHLVRQSGADSVVISSETAGRMLGLATMTPSVVEMMEDLLSPDSPEANVVEQGDRLLYVRRVYPAEGSDGQGNTPRNPSAKNVKPRKSGAEKK